MPIKIWASGVALLVWAGGPVIFTAKAADAAPGAAAAAPKVFWASEPARPDDTVMLTGEDMAGAAAVAVGRVDDGPAGAPSATAAPRVAGWRSEAPAQVSAQCVKFVLPRDISRGIFACRIIGKNSQSRLVLLNAPDPWWIQGDEGAAASPGGWLRVFGNCLRSGSKLFLQSAGGKTILEAAPPGDDYSLRFAIPRALRVGVYSAYVHNGYGGNAGWRPAGKVEVRAPESWPDPIFRVMDFYGADADKEILRTLTKGSPSVDRTEAVEAALKKAAAAGGGTVFFAAGSYTLSRALQGPPHTLLKGAAMGLVSIWWGKGNLALDGGSSERRLNAADGVVPPEMVSGTDYGLEDLSLILPREYQTGIAAGNNFRMRRVRIRVDRYWVHPGDREGGDALRLGDGCQVTDCDILARGDAVTMGHYAVLARNKILAGKCNVSLGHSDRAIVEDNQFTSLDPTAYINLSGEGRNLYYARNHHDSLYAQQSDFSFTFDGTGQAYLGTVASTQGDRLELAHDPTYPDWAKESDSLWKRSVVCVLSGRGAGQYRFVTANAGRQWQVDRPFDVPPDAESIVSIIPFRGRVLVIGNHFEDAGWVNMGYGSSFDVICANNSLYRVGEFLNLGLRGKDGVMPSWYVQYFNNDVFEGHTLVQSTGDQRNPEIFSGSVTRGCVHRGQHIHADNSGSIDVGGNATDVVVEQCRLDNALSKITVRNTTRGVFLRENQTRGAAQGLTPRPR